MGCTIAELAYAKGLSPATLRFLGWSDGRYKVGGAWVYAIEIPYLDEKGADPRVRYRVALTGDRFRWRSGSRSRPYGLWLLDRARKVGYVLVVEGETDAATLVHHGFPVVGIPGAATFKDEWAGYLKGLTVYVWQEPGRAGAEMVARIAALCPDVRVIPAPDAHKDPCAMAQALGDGFAAALRELVAKAVVPVVVCRADTTTGTDGDDAAGMWAPGPDEREALAALFPIPLDDSGKPVRPGMYEVAQVRRDNPRWGATHLKVSNTWQNGANAQYRRRGIFAFIRHAFREHLGAGGQVFRHVLTVPTALPEDASLLAAELREWDRLRKSLQRFEALYRWFSTLDEAGAHRVIYSSFPITEGQSPLEDPVADLLDTVRAMQPPGDPYPKRRSHDGPADAWRPPQARNKEWLSVGYRSGRALLEMDQDVYDQAAAAAHGVATWRATAAEVEARDPEAIVQTRHWKAPANAPADTLPSLWQSLGFSISWTKWEATFDPGGPERASAGVPV
jgi:hypothetical protein